MTHDLSASDLAQLEALREAFADITGELADINPTDRVYRSVSGRHLKVRVLPVPLADPREAFVRSVWSLTASDCDAAGKALPMGETHRITPQHMLTREAHPGGRVGFDLALRLELERLRVAAIADQAGEILDQKEGA